MPARERQRLLYITRRSPYFERTLAEGALEFGVYNHTYMPFVYANDARAEYEALVGGVTLWDVGAQRQCELRGPDALRFADYLSPRDLSTLPVGGCRYLPVCDHEGKIMAEAIALRPWHDVVWISHSDCDVSLWAFGLARARGCDVQVREADVAPLQLQGPRAPAVLRPLVSAELDALPRFRCVVSEIAGVPVVISNTGWSREAGYEVYPLGSERAAAVWDAIREAGREHGLLVTGPNLSRAVEQGILDTQYRMNSGMDPFEAGMGGVVEVDGRDCICGAALRAIRERGPARRTIGLVSDRHPWPRFEDFWPVADEHGRRVGILRWAVWSYALDRNIGVALVEAHVSGDERLVIDAPDGPHPAEQHRVPFV